MNGELEHVKAQLSIAEQQLTGTMGDVRRLGADLNFARMKIFDLENEIGNLQSQHRKDVNNIIELNDKIEELEHRVEARDSIIASLSNQLEVARSDLETARIDLEAERNKDVVLQEPSPRPKQRLVNGPTAGLPPAERQG